jgi:lipoprotein-anchoring transpeptidase ErfK/SrfK
MRRFAILALMSMFTLVQPTLAAAGSLVAKVDVSKQTMNVYSNGKLAYTWQVSTARKGKITPRGTYSAKTLSRHHKSSLYNNAPMPHSIFFRGNYAIHGTNQISKLGRPASAGCIRLHPDHAATLFQMTKAVGLSNMKVVVQN